LLSIAAKQWKSKDAREEIASFVDDINDIGERECFDFDKDFVLKSCLVLSDLSEIAFKVDNFSMTNMNTIEKKWDEIKKSIKLAVELCSSFGYTRQTLTSVNAIIPLAYYIMKIGAPDNFVLSTIYQNDHKKIKKWLIISLIKRVFSGQPENVFRPIRKIMSEQSEMSEFPLEAIIDKFKGTTKTITFTDDDIDSLLNSKYGQGHTFSVLAILYPTLDYRNRFHQDHIFPKSWFKQKKLDEKNIGPQKQEFYLENMNYISNLQLLEGNPNLEKSNKDLEEWLPEIVTTSEERKEFLKKHYFPEEASLNFNDFELFINPSSIVKCNT
jgi:hypothetical protein